MFYSLSVLKRHNLAASDDPAFEPLRLVQKNELDAALVAIQKLIENNETPDQFRELYQDCQWNIEFLISIESILHKFASNPTGLKAQQKKALRNVELLASEIREHLK
jgi:hypothetical protein